MIIRTEKLDNSKDWNFWKKKSGICCDKLNEKSYQCWVQKAFHSSECPVSEKMLQYFISRSAYAYQERRDGKDESIDLYQISIFIKQIAFVAMETGISEEIINQVVPAAIGKSWELASKLLLDPMEGMKLAVELFDHGNNSLKLYGMLLRNYRVAKKALLLSDMKAFRPYGKADAGNTGLSEVTGRAFGYGNVDIDRGNEQNENFFWKREKSVYPDYGKIDYIIKGRNPDRDQ